MVLIGVGRCGRKFPFIWMFCTPILECLGRDGMHSARKLFTMYYLSLVSGVPQNFSSFLFPNIISQKEHISGALRQVRMQRITTFVPFGARAELFIERFIAKALRL